ncbi:MAG: fructose-bisphosphate aldolase class I, partial [Proteobacteria bacterium]|nr:fructose-bisphosphate aldolase class I [Pseudomonadota bacterium]
LAAGQGQDERLGNGQQALLKRARLNGLASAGGYTNDMESAA